jgi:hypothetical protein
MHFPQSKAAPTASLRSEAGVVAGIYCCCGLTLSRGRSCQTPSQFKVEGRARPSSASGRAPFLLLFGMDGRFDELTILLVSILVGAAAFAIVLGSLLLLQPYHP